MLARTPSSTRGVIFTGALMAAAMVSASPSSKAQQMAAADLLADKRRAYIERNCGSIADATAKSGCIAESTLAFTNEEIALSKQRTEEAKQQIEEARKSAAIDRQKAAAANARTECIRDLTTAILGKRITRDEVRAAFKAPSETADACEVIRRLHPRLGELSKQ